MEDVLDSFGIVAAEQAIPELDPVAATLLAHVRERAVGADELARATGLSAGELQLGQRSRKLAGLVAEEEGIYRPSG